MAHVEALLVQTDSDCPGADAVQAEIRELSTAEQRRAVPPGARAVVSDRGESIRIAVTRDGKTTVRVYHDAARDCARRSHFVSVLVVVSLMPPELGSDPELAAPPSEAGAAERDAGENRNETTSRQSETPAGEGPSAPSRSASPERGAEPEPDASDDELEGGARRPKHVWLELGARAEASTPISDSVRIAAWGAGFGVAAGAGRLRFTLAGGYVPKHEMRYTGSFAGRGDVERLDVALGARRTLGSSPVDTSFDLALVVSHVAVTGLDTLWPARGATFTPGLRAGFRVYWSEQSSVSPFLATHADVFPFAPSLWQPPQGTIGHLPYVWVGVSGGLALAL